ncbi:hypothetical protein [Vibrio owensii]|uniref:hypothetical protein n=1 Tax=Vibrio owensii TaxID=696485 RepID=UPI003CC61649
MHSDSHRIVNQIQVCCPKVKQGNAFSSDYAHIPLPGAALIDPVHIQVKLNSFEQFTVQILKSSTSQISLEKIKDALSQLGVEGEVKANASFLLNLDEQYTLRMPLSVTQSHLTIVDESLLVSGIDKYYLSDEKKSFELTKEELDCLFTSQERVEVAAVTFADTVSVNLKDKCHDYTFDTSFSVVNHCLDNSISSDLTEKDLEVASVAYSFVSGRAYDELSMLYECAGMGCGSHDCFTPGLDELLRVFPALHIMFLGHFYSTVEESEKYACTSVTDMIEILTPEKCMSWVAGVLKNTERRTETMVTTLTFLHQSDFSLMLNAADHLCEMLDESGKLKELAINKVLLSRMVVMAFYSQHIGYRLASGAQLEQYLEHILLNKQFDLVSLMETFFAIKSDVVIDRYMNHACYPDLIRQCAQTFNKSFTDDPIVRYSHIISCLFSKLANNGKLNVRMADASMSQMTDYFLAQYGIADEVEKVVSSVEAVHMFDRPDIAKEIEKQRSKIDLSFYEVV